MHNLGQVISFSLAGFLSIEIALLGSLLKYNIHSFEEAEKLAQQKRYYANEDSLLRLWKLSDVCFVLNFAYFI